MSVLGRCAGTWDDVSSGMIGEDRHRGSVSVKSKSSSLNFDSASLDVDALSMLSLTGYSSLMMY